MQLFTVYPKIVALSFLVLLICLILIRVLSSSFLEFKQSRIIWAVPGKGKQCGGEPGSSAGSAENRRAVRNALRIRADTKPENGDIFAEVLIVFILKENMRLKKKKTKQNNLKTHFSSRKNLLMN